MMKTQKGNIFIIGAGLAGLTTAYRLHQKGYNVEVYEARPRVGGRVHTVFIRNHEGSYSIAELGGQNIADGGGASHFLSLAKELEIDILENDVKFNASFYDGKNFHDKKEILSQSAIQNEEFQKKLASACKTSLSMEDILNQTLKEPIQKRMLSFMLNAYEGLPPSLLSAQPHNIQTFEHMVSGGLSQTHQAVGSSPTIHRASLKNGNAALPIKLAEKLKGHVYLEKVLTRVENSNDNTLTLTFKDGTTASCDKLILAIPCSVYNDITFNEKVIPTERLNAIKAIHYGTNGKTFFPIKYQTQAEQTFFSDTVGTIFSQDNKLLCLYSINDKASTDCHSMLPIVKAFFKNCSIDETLPIEPHDLNFAKFDSPVIKLWTRDPYAKGSYSTYDVFLQDKLAQKINYQGIEIKTPFSPIDDRIFIVGEHATLLDEVGTMEAAVESGERMAKLF